MFVHRETPALQKLTGRRKPQKNYIFQGETEEKATASYVEPAGRGGEGIRDWDLSTFPWV